MDLARCKKIKQNTHTHTLWWYFKDGKSSRRGQQVRWSDEIRNVARVDCTTRALERKQWTKLREIYIQQWIENDCF